MDSIPGECGFDIQITDIREIMSTMVYPGEKYFSRLPRTINSVVLNQRGTGNYRIDEEEFIFNEGDLFFLRSNLRHHHNNIGAIPHSYVFINFNTADDSVFDAPPFKPILMLSDHRCDFEGYFDEILMAWKIRDPGYLPRIREHLYHILNTMAAVLMQKGEDNTRYMMIRPAVAYIGNNLMGDLSMDLLSSLCRLSVRQMGRYFHEVFGKSPYEYVVETRLQTAKHLLHSTTNSVGDIAQRVGYESIYNFSRAFKHTYGVSPSEWRRQSDSSIVRLY